MAVYCEHHQRWVLGDECVADGHPIGPPEPKPVARKRPIARKKA